MSRLPTWTYGHERVPVASKIVPGNRFVMTMNCGSRLAVLSTSAIQQHDVTQRIMSTDQERHTSGGPRDTTDARAGGKLDKLLERTRSVGIHNPDRRCSVCVLTDHRQTAAVWRPGGHAIRESGGNLGCGRECCVLRLSR